MLYSLVLFQYSSFFTMMCACRSDEEWELSANNVRVIIGKDWVAATFTVSTFTLIGPDAGYAGVYTQAEICAAKLCFRKMCSYYV